jgi:hypothetical protein
VSIATRIQTPPPLPITNLTPVSDIPPQSANYSPSLPTFSQVSTHPKFPSPKKLMIIKKKTSDCIVPLGRLLRQNAKKVPLRLRRTHLLSNRIYDQHLNRAQRRQVLWNIFRRSRELCRVPGCSCLVSLSLSRNVVVVN